MPSAEECLGETRKLSEGGSTQTKSSGQIGIVGWKGGVGIPVEEWRMCVKAREALGCSEYHRKSSQPKGKRNRVEGRKQALVNYSGNKNFAMELLLCSKNCTEFSYLWCTDEFP